MTTRTTRTTTTTTRRRREETEDAEGLTIVQLEPRQKNEQGGGNRGTVVVKFL
jgi:hypothetical protein